MTVSHEDFIQEQLQEVDFQKDYLRETIIEFAQDGDYNEFYRSLEQIIKARGTVKEFAEKTGLNRANLLDLLHGKTQTSPNFRTILKILDGLGYALTVTEKKRA